MATSPDRLPSGFSPQTSTFHSLRHQTLLPSPSLPLSLPSFILSLLPSPLPSHPALLSTTGSSLSYPSFLSQLHNLSHNLHSHLNLPKPQPTAFILSPSRLDLPVLYLSLLSLGLSIAPANPASTPQEISRLFSLINPTVAFVTSATASNIPPNTPTVLLDSPLFRSFLHTRAKPLHKIINIKIKQTDTAVIQFSSGTTGAVKAAAVSHRNLIALIAGASVNRAVGKVHVTMVMSPMFHSMGFAVSLGGLAMGDTTVVVDRPGLKEMMEAMERWRVTLLVTAPPMVVAMGREEEVTGFNIRALEEVVCGGAPLAVDDAVRFRQRFPRVLLRQVRVENTCEKIGQGSSAIIKVTAKVEYF